MTKKPFSGRRAVVTGGAQGLGLEISERLQRDGAEVAVWDLQTMTEHPTLLALGGIDIRNPASVDDALKRTLSELGGIDILVNNAGISGPNVPTVDYDVEAWHQVLDTNLTGTFLVCRAVIPQMIEAGYGRVVNIASVAGKDGNPNAPAYSASKAGVMALTKSLAKELAKTGVLVNCITPAVIKTPIFSQMTQEHIDYMLSKIPMERFGQKEELAAMVAWLASSECSFSTGAIFDLSGGRSTY